MKLTNVACKNAKAKAKAYKIFDGGGLYLEIMPSGNKLWRFKYHFLGVEKRISFGAYPLVSLVMAREERDRAKRLLLKNVDPSSARQGEKREIVRIAALTFEVVAREWHERQSERWAQKTGEKIMRYLENDIFPRMGSRPIRSIDPTELLSVLRKIEDRGAYYNARRIKQYCSQIFRYAVATGRCDRDPSTDLKGALRTSRTKHYAALEIKEMPEFLKALERNDARLFASTRRGMKLLMLTLTRTSELIHAKRSELNFEKEQWEIPAERMKMRKPHVVPLSRQAIAIFKEQLAETDHLNTEWIFPNQVRPLKPMSNNTILFGIKRMGYQGHMTGHGFRALAMTAIMEELNYPHEIPDIQLGHTKGDNVRRAYDRTKFMDKRRKMMQEWADYLDALAAGHNAIKPTGE